MQETIKIKIAGIEFYINEDAYRLLRMYLNRVTEFYQDKEGGDEIIQDLEARIAELFQEKISEGKEVIELSDVEQAIDVVGKPEEIFETEDESYDEKASSKKLYRDNDNAVLAGVCAGLAKYFGIDKGVVRVIFVILFFANLVGFFVYIVLWVITPPARTLLEKERMHGKRMKYSDVQHSVKEEFNKVKDNVGDYKESPYYNQVKTGAESAVSVLGRIILIFFKVILAIIGISLVFTGLGGVLSFTGVAFFAQSDWVVDEFNWNVIGLQDFMELVVDPSNVPLLMLATALVIGLPLLFLIYGGIRLVLQMRINDRKVWVSGILIWVASIVFLALVSVYAGKEFISYSKEVKDIRLENFESDTIYIHLENTEMFDEDDANVKYIEDLKIVQTRGEQQLFIEPELDIKKTRDDSFKLKMTRRSRAYTKSIANEYVENISYKWRFSGDTLYLSSYASLDGMRWRFQEIELDLYIPVGKTVYFDYNTYPIIDDIYSKHYVSNHELFGQYWLMGNHGLEEKK